MGEPTDPIERARRPASVESTRELYDEWAERYDHDVFELAGVTGSRQVADLLADHVGDRTTPVLDLGCGTGAVGRHLAAHGFSDITGVDLSPGMLAVAERVGAYRQLIETDLTQPLDLPRRFGASVSAGTFTTRHVQASRVAGILSVHRPGAVIVWAISPAHWPEFHDELQRSGADIRTSAAVSIRPDRDDRVHMVVAAT